MESSGRFRILACAAAVVLCSVQAAPAAAQPPFGFDPPLTPWGHPGLQGI